MYAAKRGGRRNVIWHPTHEDMLERERFPTRASDATSTQVDPRVLRLADVRRRIAAQR